MNRLSRLVLSLMLVATVGCTTSGPRGLSWGFKKKPNSKEVETAERDSKLKDDAKATRSTAKNSTKKDSKDSALARREMNPKSDKIQDRADSIEDLLAEARSCDDRNDLNGAEKLYREILRKDPDHPGALRRVANIMDLQNRFPEAEEYYNRGLALRPDDPELLNDLGYSYFLQARYDESETVLRKALALKPDYVYAMNNLGYLAAKRAQQSNDYRDYQVAQELFQQANGQEASQKMLEELFPNGPPQALAQTSNQTNPFAASRPVVPPQERNPFEPLPPPAEYAAGPAGNPNSAINPQSSPVTPQPQGVMASSMPVANGSQLPPFTPAEGAPVGAGQPQPPLNSIQINPTQPGAIADNSVAPQPPEAANPVPSNQLPQWNTAPAGGTVPASAMWEDAQRSAAQLSLNAMFPVSNAVGTPVYSSGQSQPLTGNYPNPALNSPNPSTGWTNNGANPLDRPATSGPSTIPGQNGNAVPAQNSGGWQGQPVGGQGGFPAPNPFENNTPTLPANPAMTPRGTQPNGGYPGTTSSHGGQPGAIQPVGATATDIELFEAELLQQTGPRNQGQPNGAGAYRRTQNSGPLIQPANATY